MHNIYLFIVLTSYYVVKYLEKNGGFGGNSVISEPYKPPKISGKAWGVLVSGMFHCSGQELSSNACSTTSNIILHTHVQLLDGFP